MPAAVRGLLRRVRADGGLLAPYAVSVCLISLALCAGPTVLNQMSDDGIRAAVRDEPIVRSALIATTQQRLKPGPPGGNSRTNRRAATATPRNCRAA